MKTPGYFAILIVGYLLLLGGCQNQPVVPPPAIGEKGWETFGTATTGEPPGTIYRVDTDGVVWQVTKAMVDAEKSSVLLYKVSSDRDITFQELLEGLGITKNVPVGVDAQLGLKTTAERASTTGTKEEFDDKSAPDIEAALMNVKIRPDNKYYIIRATVSTDELTFTVSNKFISSLKLDASTSAALKSKSSMSASNGDSISYSGKLPEKMRIWYKAEKIEIKSRSAAGGGTPPEVVFVKGSTLAPLKINKVAFNP